MRARQFAAAESVYDANEGSLRMNASTRFRTWSSRKTGVASLSTDSIVNAIEKYVQESSERERPTSKIGEMIMRRLKELDKVAYVRFASVYLEFEDVSEFMTELKHLVRTRANQAARKN